MGELFEEFHFDSGRMNISHSMEEPGGLIGDAGDDPRMTMADVRDAEGGAEVHKSISVHIPDVDPLRAFPEDWFLGVETGDIGAFDFRQAFCQSEGTGSRDRCLQCRRG